MARLEITTPSEQSVYELRDEFVTIGGAVGNHLRLSDPAVAPVHLRLVHAEDGYRLEAADPALEVAVNGEPCARRLLVHADEIRIGDTTLRFLDARAAQAPAPAARRQTAVPAAAAPRPVRRAQPPAPPPPAPRQAEPRQAAPRPHAAGHHHSARATRKPMSWRMWLPIVALAVAVLVILMRMSGAGSYFDENSSPEHFLALAEKEFQQGSISRALDNCQLAELQGPGAAVRQRIQDLRARIKAQQRRSEDQPTLDLAQRSLDAMQKTESKHLAAAQSRPAARAIVRGAKTWLQNYSDVVRRYQDRAGDVAKVQALLDRYTPQARLDQPDDYTDVQFAVEQRLALEPPLYAEALGAVDDFVAAHPHDEHLTELHELRNTVVSTARTDFDRHEAEARKLLQLRRFAEAGKELQAMRNAIVVHAWQEIADAVGAELERAAK